MNGAGRCVVGADIGGTFTDLVLLFDDGRVATRKVLSTVDDYGDGILAGLEALLDEHAVPPAAIDLVAHGTTVATNAILEGRGARTGLITTRGFRDVLEIGRLRLPRLYDPDWEKPPALVPRELRFEVRERLDAAGGVVEPLDEDDVVAAVRALAAHGVDSLAIAFLHAYRNDEHERRAGAIAAREAPDLDVSLSSAVLPELREYERTSTTVINAYVRPVLRRYLQALRQRLRAAGVAGPLWVMQSTGGLFSAASAVARPVRVIESGPAAGVVGAAGLARRLGRDSVITFDMGGTTAKVSVVEGGQPALAPEYEVGAGLNIGSRLLRGGGYALRVPAIDIAEVGAGGGSVVWIDSGGAPRVGPRSAGASPGPVAYGRGGVETTITDANVVLGYVRTLAGGSVPLDVERARHAIVAQLAQPLGLTPEEAAFGARRVANSSMLQAVRAMTVERGRDARGFCLIAFGGNGPVHAVDVALDMGIREVLVPPAPGVFSALGLCLAEIEQHFARAFLSPLDGVAPAQLERAFAALEGEAVAALGRDGLTSAAVQLDRRIDVRYRGQSEELTVPLAGAVDGRALERLRADFVAEHERTYGHADRDDPQEVVSVRVIARADGRRPSTAEPAAGAGAQAVGERHRAAYFGRRHGWLDVPVLGELGAFRDPRAGPLLVELYDATVVVPPGWQARLEAHGALVLSGEAAR